MVSTAKLGSLGILFFIALICGLIIPYILLKILTRKCQSSATFRRIIAVLNCFSGGVFVGTCLLTLLPEAREQFLKALAILNPSSSYPYTELLLGIGFLVILLTESVTHTVFEKRVQKAKNAFEAGVLNNLHALECRKEENTTGEKHSCNEYCASYQNGHVKVVEISASSEGNQSKCEQFGLENPRTRNDTSSTCLSESVFAQGMSDLHSFVLILALSIHMLFEGLSLGLQDEESGVWSLLLAMSFHKVLLFLSSGVAICESTTTVKFTIAMIFMASVSPFGVGIGIALTSQQENASLTTASAVLQGFAVGTFAYVALFEILLKEFSANEADRIVKAGSVIVGYVLIAIVKYTMPEMKMPELVESIHQPYMLHI